MGETVYVLGLEIIKDHAKKFLGLYKEAYIKKVLRRLKS